MIIHAHVKPGSSKGPLVEERADGTYTIFVREVPEHGEATDAAIRALADHFDVAPSRVALVRGGTSRHKTFELM